MNTHLILSLMGRIPMNSFENHKQETADTHCRVQDEVVPLPEDGHSACEPPNRPLAGAEQGTVDRALDALKETRDESENLWDGYNLTVEEAEDKIEKAV